MAQDVERREGGNDCEEKINANEILGVNVRLDISFVAVVVVV